jgi:hypothetical protein
MNYSHWLAGSRKICLTKNVDSLITKLCRELFIAMSITQGHRIFMRRSPAIAVHKTFSRGDTSEVIVSCRFSIMMVSEEPKLDYPLFGLAKPKGPPR